MRSFGSMEVKEGQHGNGRVQHRNDANEKGKRNCHKHHQYYYYLSNVQWLRVTLSKWTATNKKSFIRNSVAKSGAFHFAIYFILKLQIIIVNETNWLHAQINLTILLFDVEKVWIPKCNLSFSIFSYRTEFLVSLYHCIQWIEDNADNALTLR